MDQLSDSKSRRVRCHQQTPVAKLDGTRQQIARPLSGLTLPANATFVFSVAKRTVLGSTPKPADRKTVAPRYSRSANCLTVLAPVAATRKCGFVPASADPETDDNTWPTPPSRQGKTSVSVPRSSLSFISA